MQFYKFLHYQIFTFIYIYKKVICMMVKDTAGSEFNAATNGKANLGVVLGM